MANQNGWVPIPEGMKLKPIDFEEEELKTDKVTSGWVPVPEGMKLKPIDFEENISVEKTPEPSLWESLKSKMESFGSFKTTPGVITPPASDEKSRSLSDIWKPVKEAISKEPEPYKLPGYRTPAEVPGANRAEKAVNATEQLLGPVSLDDKRKPQTESPSRAIINKWLTSYVPPDLSSEELDEQFLNKQIKSASKASSLWGMKEKNDLVMINSVKKDLYPIFKAVVPFAYKLSKAEEMLHKSKPETMQAKEAQEKFMRILDIASAFIEPASAVDAVGNRIIKHVDLSGLAGKVKNIDYYGRKLVGIKGISIADETSEKLANLDRIRQADIKQLPWHGEEQKLLEAPEGIKTLEAPEGRPALPEPKGDITHKGFTFRTRAEGAPALEAPEGKAYGETFIAKLTEDLAPSYEQRIAKAKRLAQLDIMKYGYPKNPLSELVGAEQQISKLVQRDAQYIKSKVGAELAKPKTPQIRVEPVRDFNPEALKNIRPVEREVPEISSRIIENKVLGKYEPGYKSADAFVRKLNVDKFRELNGLPPLSPVPKEELKAFTKSKNIEALNAYRKKRGLEPFIPTQFHSMAGGAAGIEFDDEGNIKGFNPVLAMAGIAASTFGASKLAGIKNAKKFLRREGKHIFNPGIIKDVDLWEKVQGLPHFMAKKYKLMADTYTAQRLRDKARSTIRHEFMQSLEPFFKLKGQELDDTQRLLVKGDIEGVTFKDTDIIKSGFSPKVLEAYQSVRNTLDKVHGDYVERLRANGIPEDEVRQMIAQINKTGGYLPRTRYGKYFISGIDYNGVKQRYHFDSKREGSKILAEMEKNKMQVIDQGKITKLPEEVYFQVSPEAINAIISEGTKDLAPELRREILSHTADVIKGRGFGGHGISRGEFVGGYETNNIKRVLADYVSGYSGYITKMDAAKQFSGILSKAAWDGQAKLQPKLYEYTSKYVRDVMHNDDIYDKISEKIRTALFVKYLGGVMKTGGINLTQNYIMAAPRLSMETDFAYAKLTKAMYDIGNHYKQRALPEIEQRALREGLQNGVSQDLYFQEIMGSIDPNRAGLQKFIQATGWFMSTAEKFNRQSTLLAGFRVFHKKGLKAGMVGDDLFKYALKKAEDIVDDSHFVFGKSNKPPILTGSEAGRVLSSAYAFRSFAHNYLSMMAHMYKTDKIAVAKSVASLAALSGVSGLPLFKTFEAIAAKHGWNARSELKKATEKLEWGGYEETLADGLMYGLPGVAGIDISGSVGIEVPGQRDLATGSAGDIAKNTIVDIMGAPVNLVSDTYAAYEQLGYKDYWQALEKAPFMPMAGSQVMKAIREQVDGKTSSATGKKITDEEYKPIKVSTAQAIGKGLGFKPVAESENYRKYNARKIEMTRWDDKSKNLKVQYNKLATTKIKSGKSLPKLLAKIREFNRTKPAYISYIDVDELNKALFEQKPMNDKQFLLNKEIR